MLMVMVSVFVPLASAQTTTTTAIQTMNWDSAIVSGSNLRVNLKGVSNIKYEISGGTIDGQIEPIRNQKIDETTYLYQARVYVKFSLVFWTELRVADACSATSGTSSQEWLDLVTMTDETFQSNLQESHLSVSYNKYSIPTIKSTAKGFSGKVNVNTSLVDLNPNVLDFGNDQIQIDANEFTASLNELIVMSSSSQNIADYTSVVQSVGETTLSALDIATPTGDAAAKCGQASSLVTTTITSSNLGVFRLTQTTPTLQQGAVTAPAQGANVKDGMNLRIIPNILTIQEGLKVRKQKIAVDIQSGALGTSPARILTSMTTPVEERTIGDRVIGWKVENFAVKVDLKAEFYLYAKCQVHQLTDGDKPNMEIPDAQISTYIWTSDLTGGTGAEVIVDSSDPFANWLGSLWENYKGIIIAVIIIAVLVAAGYVLFFTPIGSFLLGSMSSRRR